jgi:nucleoside-diphosphate-sugar epimerase
MKIDTSSPVMVTGVTGYIGGVIVKDLMEAGVTVHCPVRDPSNTAKLQYLTDIEAKSSGCVKFFKADLLDEGSYRESIEGCSIVIHVASPFIMDVPKGKEKEFLLDPAIKGTLSVMKSASEVSTVNRLVLTSSCYSIAIDGTDTQEVFKKTSKKCNEESWNTSASVDYNPYAYSKVLAEKAAWKFMEDNKSTCKYELVACLPGFVMGPGLKVVGSSTSYGFVKSLGDGTYKDGIIKAWTPIVDVRDVSKGHINAAFLPSEKVAGERFILNGTDTELYSIGLSIAENSKYENYPIAKKVIPKWFIWLIAPFVGMTRKYVWRTVNVPMIMDNSKSISGLEMESYIPLATTMQDMFQQCIDAGFIPEPAAAK